MHQYDTQTDIRSTLCRSLAIFAEHLIPETLGDAPVLLPPGAERTHVMCRSRADGEIRITPSVGKLMLGILRHTLDFQRQDTEFPHHVRHAIRNHTQVLATRKHSRTGQQIRQFAKCGITPERIVPPVEKVVMQPVEGVLLPVRKIAVMIRILSPDARMPISLPVRVFHKEGVNAI